jgi:hypothetical protein
MAEEIINDVDENGFEIIDTPIQEALDLSNLATFLKEAIATDTAIEYTVPLNDDRSFINAHYYDPDKGEDFITEAKVNVTVLEHLYNPSEEAEFKACDDWLIELKLDGELFSKEVKINETASFEFLQEDINEEGVDAIIASGVGRVELSITAIDTGHELSEIKISVS